MQRRIPRIVVKAIEDGSWCETAPGTLQYLLRPVVDGLPEIELFRSAEVMCAVSYRVADPCYVDDPEFCMLDPTRVRSGKADPRLDVASAIFIAGSVVPGDDVFVALDLRHNVADPDVFVFDWSKTVPRRWVSAGQVSSLVRSLAVLGKRTTI